MRQERGLEIAEELWEIVTGPTACNTDPEALRRVLELTVEFREDPELSGNLHMKAVEVEEQAKVLFDADRIRDEYAGQVRQVKTLANNAVYGLKIVVKRELS